MARIAEAPTLGPKIKLFTADGPWLHCNRQSPHFDAESLASKFSDASRNHMTPEVAHIYLKSVTAHNNDILHTYRGPDKYAINYEAKKYLGFKTLPVDSSRVDVQASSKKYVAQAMLPLIAFDALSHAIDPACLVPAVARRPHRPTNNQITHLRSNSSWVRILQETSHHHAACIEKPTSTHHLTVVCVKKPPKNTGAYVNLRQAIFVVGLYLTGDFSLSPESITRYMIADATRAGITLTEGDITYLSTPEFSRKLITPLFLALAHSVLLVLEDTESAVIRNWNPVACFELWRSAGNEHRRDPSHPLTVIERLLWRLIFEAATYARTPEEVLVEFFQSIEVKSALSGPCDPLHANPLSYDTPAPIVQSVPPAPASAPLSSLVAGLETELTTAQQATIRLQSLLDVRNVELRDVRAVLGRETAARELVERQRSAAEEVAKHVHQRREETLRMERQRFADHETQLNGLVAGLEGELAAAQQAATRLQSTVDASTVELRDAHAALEAERMATEARERRELTRRLTAVDLQRQQQELTDREKRLNDWEAKLRAKEDKFRCEHKSLVAKLAHSLQGFQDIDIASLPQTTRGIAVLSRDARPPKRKRAEESRAQEPTPEAAAISGSPPPRPPSLANPGPRLARHPRAPTSVAVSHGEPPPQSQSRTPNSPLFSEGSSDEDDIEMSELPQRN
ncbi:hypothetical protein DFH09DRAFT_1157271 [Mycena vulgaris]|nr:hypothetical protein DFH09DRAFT_1157271 [Mycena vulgaris]